MKVDRSSRARVGAVAVLALLAGILSGGRESFGQINVFMDYTNFQTRLNEATTAAGVANFNAGEVATIQTNILNSLNTSFAGLNVNFTPVNPGGTFETLNFGLTAGGGTLGLADRIDFRNLVGTDVARVFTGNFSSFIEAGDARGDQIQEISMALGGTAAHEIGHNLGLEHRDCYGIAGLGVADGNGGHGTGGAQNLHLMATGISGLSEAQREVQRSFSDLSLVKLEFANGVVTTPIAPIAEQGGAHGTAGTAQSVALTALSQTSSGFTAAAAVMGSLSAAGQFDFYSVQLNAGDFLTLEVMSEVLFTSNIDSVMTVFASNGFTALTENDDTELALNSVNQGGNLYSLDSSIFNFQAPSTGMYFVRVRAFGVSDTGAYELLFAASQVPEAGASLILGLFALTSLGMRRRKA